MFSSALSTASSLQRQWGRGAKSSADALPGPEQQAEQKHNTSTAHRACTRARLAAASISLPGRWINPNFTEGRAKQLVQEHTWSSRMPLRARSREGLSRVLAAHPRNSCNWEAAWCCGLNWQNHEKIKNKIWSFCYTQKQQV